MYLMIIISFLFNYRIHIAFLLASSGFTPLFLTAWAAAAPKSLTRLRGAKRSEEQKELEIIDGLSGILHTSASISLLLIASLPALRYCRVALAPPHLAVSMSFFICSLLFASATLPE